MSPLHRSGDASPQAPEARAPAGAPPAVVAGFIVGMARAGTSWLAEALHRHPQMAVFGESAFWGRHYVAPGADGRYSAEGLQRLRQTVGSTHMRSAEPGDSSEDVTALFHEVLDAFERSGTQPTPREVFDQLAAAVGSTGKKPLVLEKTPHHVNWLKRIRHAYPRARVVVMVRDPYGFMRSYKHQGDRKRPDVQGRFRARYHPAACALVYRRSLASARAARSVPGTLHVHFDDVRHMPDRVLDEVQAFLGLAPASLTVPPSNSSFPQGARPDLDPIDVFWMNRIAGREIRRAGYAVRPSGAGPAAVARSLLGLPAWLGTVYGHKTLSLRYLIRWLR